MAYRFCSGRIEQSALRPRNGVPGFASIMRVRLSQVWQPGLSPGFIRRSDPAIRHHLAMPEVAGFLPLPASMKSHRAQSGFGPAYSVLCLAKRPAPYKGSPASAGGTAPFTTENPHALYQQHRFSHSVRIQCCTRYTVRTGQRLSETCAYTVVCSCFLCPCAGRCEYVCSLPNS